MSIALSNLEIVHRQQGQYDSAYQLRMRANNISESIGDNYRLAIDYNNLGDWYKATRDYETSLIWYLKSLDLKTSMDNRKGMAHTMEELMDSYMILGDLRQAEYYGLKGLQIAEELNLREKSLRLLETISEMYAAFGDYKEAFNFRIKFENVKQDIFNESKSLQIADMQAHYETEKKEAENELLKAQSSEQEVTISRQNIIVISALTGLAIFTMLMILLYRSSQQKRKINAELVQRQEELEKLNATKDRFFGIIAHDLRNPVISFQGISRLIDSYLKKGKTEKIGELSDKIQHSVNNLNQLLDNLLNWASSQTSALPYQPEPLPVAQVIAEAIGLFADTADAKQITINNQVDEQIIVYADRNGISTIFRNLINNALKFTPDGGKIKIAAEPAGENVKIVTTDNGVGIDQSKISSLFQLSNDKSTQGTSGEKGTGLGLVLCQEFAKANKGLIWVESELRKGSSFYVSMPKYTA